MKQSPAYRRVAERMAPGVLCRDGFLAPDRRRLEEILETDNSAVVGLGTTHQAIAARLQAVYDQARAGLGRHVEVGEGRSALWREAMGRIPCPWGGCGTFAKGEVELTNAATGETLRFTALGIHLVEAHGFYQGRGSRYRLEPAALARALGLPEEG